MTMFGGRYIILLLVLVLGFGFALHVFSWDSNKYKCLNGRHWMGPHFVVFQIGRFQFDAQEYNCDPSDRYNPKDSHPLYSQPSDNTSL